MMEMVQKNFGNLEVLEVINLTGDEGEMRVGGRSTSIRCINYLEEPAFRAKEARKRNHPIGMMETGDGLLSMRSPVPDYRYFYKLHALHCRARNT